MKLFHLSIVNEKRGLAIERDVCGTLLGQSLEKGTKTVIGIRYGWNSINQDFRKTV